MGQRVFAIALGYEDLNDHDELRIGVHPVPELAHVGVIARCDDRTAVFADAIKQDRQQQGVLGIVAVEQRRPCGQRDASNVTGTLERSAVRHRKKLVSFERTLIRARNVIFVLKNPFYAGVYAYGKGECDARSCRENGAPPASHAGQAAPEHVPTTRVDVLTGVADASRAPRDGGPGKAMKHGQWRTLIAAAVIIAAGSAAAQTVTVGAASTISDAILAEATPIKSPAIYAAITPPGINPDGRVNPPSLAYDLAFYRAQGLIKGAVNLDDVLDPSFADAVVKELGPFRQ